MKEIPISREYARLDFEYTCLTCRTEWARCLCPVPEPAAVQARIAAERARLLGR